MKTIKQFALIALLAVTAHAQYTPPSGGSSGGAVSSVFTRTGAVVAAPGDYTAAQVTNAVDTTQTYSNPGWITALAATKITGAGPITLTGSGAGLDLFGCGTQTIPGSPANAVGIMAPASCTGQHVIAPPATGATGSTQFLAATGAESGGTTQLVWAVPGGGGTTVTYSQPYIQFGSASYWSSQDTVPAGSWTWVNQGTSTLVTTAGGALHFIWTAEGVNHARGYVQNIPASTYTLKIHCAEGFVQGCGLFLYDGTKCRTFFSGTDNKLHVFSYATATTAAGNVFTSGLVGTFPTSMWWKLVDDGTHRTFFVSPYDGDYQQIFQELTNAGLTPTQVGAGTDDSFSGLAAAPDAFILSFTLTTP